MSGINALETYTYADGWTQSLPSIKDPNISADAFKVHLVRDPSGHFRCPVCIGGKNYTSLHKQNLCKHIASCLKGSSTKTTLLSKADADGKVFCEVCETKISYKNWSVHESTGVHKQAIAKKKADLLSPPITPEEFYAALRARVDKRFNWDLSNYISVGMGTDEIPTSNRDITPEAVQRYLEDLSRTCAWKYSPILLVPDGNVRRFLPKHNVSNDLELSAAMDRLMRFLNDIGVTYRNGLFRLNYTKLIRNKGRVEVDQLLNVDPLEGLHMCFKVFIEYIHRVGGLAYNICRFETHVKGRDLEDRIAYYTQSTTDRLISQLPAGIVEEIKELTVTQPMAHLAQFNATSYYRIVDHGNYIEEDPLGIRAAWHMYMKEKLKADNEFFMGYSTVVILQLKETAKIRDIRKNAKFQAHLKALEIAQVTLDCADWIKSCSLEVRNVGTSLKFAEKEVYQTITDTTEVYKAEDSDSDSDSNSDSDSDSSFDEDKPKKKVKITTKDKISETVYKTTGSNVLAYLASQFYTFTHPPLPASVQQKELLHYYAIKEITTHTLKSMEEYTKAASMQEVLEDSVYPMLVKHIDGVTQAPIRSIIKNIKFVEVKE